MKIETSVMTRFLSYLAHHAHGDNFSRVRMILTSSGGGMERGTGYAPMIPAS